MDIFGAIQLIQNLNGKNVMLLNKEIKKVFGDTKDLNTEESRIKLDQEDNASTGKINLHILIAIFQNTLDMLDLKKTIVETQWQVSSLIQFGVTLLIQKFHGNIVILFMRNIL